MYTIFFVKLIFGAKADCNYFTFVALALLYIVSLFNSSILKLQHEKILPMHSFFQPAISFHHINRSKAITHPNRSRQKCLY